MPLRVLAIGYNLFIRGVPEFLLLLLVFFGSERLLNGLFRLVRADTVVSVPKFIAAVAGLSLIFAAYCSEVLRGAYLAVPRGQIEAALAAGMSPAQIFFRVRLPQLWRFAIPGLANLWMVMLKDTSLAAVIALDELLRVAKVAGETSASPLLFFFAAGALYLVMTAVSDRFRVRLETKSRIGMAKG